MGAIWICCVVDKQTVIAEKVSMIKRQLKENHGDNCTNGYKQTSNQSVIPSTADSHQLSAMISEVQIDSKLCI
jgi:hypothetical protein